MYRCPESVQESIRIITTKSTAQRKMIALIFTVEPEPFISPSFKCYPLARSAFGCPVVRFAGSLPTLWDGPQKMKLSDSRELENAQKCLYDGNFTVRCIFATTCSLRLGKWSRFGFHFLRAVAGPKGRGTPQRGGQPYARFCFPPLFWPLLMNNTLAIS